MIKMYTPIFREEPKVIYEHTLQVLKLTAERTLNKQGVLAIFGITHFAYAVFTKFFRQVRCL